MRALFASSPLVHALALSWTGLVLSACASDPDWADTGSLAWSDSSGIPDDTLGQRSERADEGTGEGGLLEADLPCGAEDVDIFKHNLPFGDFRLAWVSIETESECGKPPVVWQWSRRFGDTETKIHKEVVMTDGTTGYFLLWNRQTLSITCPWDDDVTEEDCCSYSLRWDLI